MYKVLRIISSVIAAAAAAVTVLIAALFGFWGFLPAGICVLFALLMFFFKNRQEKEEAAKNPAPPEGDFITGKVAKSANPRADDGEEQNNAE